MNTPTFSPRDYLEIEVDAICKTALFGIVLKGGKQTIKIRGDQFAELEANVEPNIKEYEAMFKQRAKEISDAKKANNAFALERLDKFSEYPSVRFMKEYGRGPKIIGKILSVKNVGPAIDDAVAATLQNQQIMAALLEHFKQNPQGK